MKEQSHLNKLPFFLPDIPYTTYRNHIWNGTHLVTYWNTMQHNAQQRDFLQAMNRYETNLSRAALGQKIEWERDRVGGL